MFPVEKKLSNMSPFIALATISNRLQVLYVLSILDHKSRLRIVKFNQETEIIHSVVSQPCNRLTDRK